MTHKEQIRQMLYGRWVHIGELMKVTPRYGARIFDLRDAGVRVDGPVRHSGRFYYRIPTAKETQPGEQAEMLL